MTAAQIFPEERRAHPRHRVMKRVKAVFNSNRSVIDCVMRDLSVGGARLSCAQANQLPDHFDIVIMTAREIRSVRVAWRGLDEMGVAFTSAPRKALHLLL